MKPLMLILSAFGPYSQRTELDFTKLGTNGIYLLTGETGAGKTTIFDAISFALFGKASGNNRESSMLRSKYASEETPTFAELHFEHGEKLYRIKRNPEYDRPKVKGEGLTREKANAELYLPDGRIITRSSEVDSAISEILGIDGNQFSQIAMIAQGDFLRLLLASTDDRLKIFRKLFKTDFYSKIQEELQSKKTDLSREFAFCSERIKQSLSGIRLDSYAVSMGLTAEAIINQPLSSDSIDLLLGIIKRDEQQQIQTDEACKSQEEAISRLTKALAKAEAQEKQKIAKAKALAELAGCNERLLEATEELDLLAREKPKADTTRELISRHKAQLPRYKELAKKTADKNNNTARLSYLANESNKAQAELCNSQKERQAAIARLDSLSDTNEKIVRLESEIKSNNELLDRINKLFESSDELKNKDRLLQNAKSRYISLREESIKASEDYNRKRTAYLNEQAGIIAEGLSEGEPCPVCGSLSHPKPATKSQQAPTKQELDLAESRAAQKKQEEEKASKASGIAENEYKIFTEQFLKDANSLFEAGSVDEAMAKLFPLATQSKEKKAALEKTYTQLKIEAQQAQSLNKRIADLEIQINKQGEQISTLASQLAAVKEALKLNDEDIKELSQSLSFESEEVALKSIAELTDKLNKFDNKEKQLNELINSLNAKKTGYEAQIKTIESSSEGREIGDISVLKEQLTGLEKTRRQTDEVKKQIFSRLEANRAIIEFIRKESKNIANIEEKLSWLTALSDTANGKLTGKDKIRLETFVQMRYLDKILNRANLRLMIMTDGQFELKRRREGRLSGQTGLDLDVIDHYNGSERSVKSLSGGESFMASLSLALGLSDTVQASSGGIKIESMFVDEGFGSLDDDTLEQAIKALSSLAEGNCTIGIISHVATLKNRIDRQIQVTKNPTGGSSIRISV